MLEEPWETATLLGAYDDNDDDDSTYGHLGKIQYMNFIENFIGDIYGIF